MHAGASDCTRLARAAMASASLGLAALLASCGAGPVTRPTETGPSLSPVRYALEVDEGLERMTQTICSEGPWTTRLVPIHEEGRARLLRAERVAPDGTVTALPAVRGASGVSALPTAALAADDCVRLALDVGTAGGGLSGCLRGDGYVVCATSAWVFAAEPWRPSSRHRVTVTLPDGLAMSPVLARDEAGLYLDERSYRYVGYAAFGRLETTHVAVPGGCTSVTVPASSPLGRSPHLEPWIARAGLASAELTGLATARGAAITAISLPGRGPVLFGMAGRGVVPSVLLFAAEAPGPELIDDWTLVHELAHLAVPYVSAEDAWLSEGLATYYQEVLRARAGSQSAEAAWRAINEGLRRGAAEGTGRTLREESQAMHATRAYTRVYWAGAALALLVDVELRSRGLGSLDERIARVASRRDRTLSAEALLAELDDVDGTVRALTARWLDDVAFPDVSAAYARLGLSRDGESLVLGAEAGLRGAIMNGRSDLASNGPCPAAPGGPGESAR
jgi:hypothetical protein